MNLTARVKDFVLGQGMDIVGVARAEDIPASFPPRPASAVLPGARSMVVLGMRVLRGSLESPNPRVTFACIDTVYGEVDRAALHLGKLIEDHGYRAALVASIGPIEMSRESRGLVGELSLKHAGQAAGLGVIGTSRLLLTPRWGPRVRLAGVVTDAPLEPDPSLEADYCAGCNICAQSCPSGAISEQGKVDVMKCVRHSQKWGMAAMIRFGSELAGKNAEEVQKQLRDPFFWNLYQAAGFRVLYDCFKCLEVCPVGKEK